MIVLAVLAVGAAAAVVRFLVTRAFGTVGVLVVNVVGSAIGGAVVALAAGDLRLVLLTGLCGGLTTFSTFSVESVQLILDGRYRRAVVNVALNLSLGIVAAAVAYVIASR